MKKYAVQWEYTSNLGGPWAADETVELDELRAEAINRDSPGVLIEVGASAAPVIPAARDRMIKRAQHRGQDGPVEAIDRTTFKAVKDHE